MKVCPDCNKEHESKSGHQRCNTCKGRRYRKLNPMMAFYHSKKSSAKYKGIPFDLTFKQFEKICEDTGYMELRGNGIADLQMDRKVIDPYLGYTESNIQIITKLENVRKGQVEKRMRKGWGIKGLEKQPGDAF